MGRREEEERGLASAEKSPVQPLALLALPVAGRPEREAGLEEELPSLLASGPMREGGREEAGPAVTGA